MSFEIHPWKIIEKGLSSDSMRFSESIFSIGNGYMGMRGTFEEDYTGDTHLGSYLAGIWFPDKTRVGWWKNGYPEYFGKAINSVRLHGIHVKIDDVLLDLNIANLKNLTRTLNLETGILERCFTIDTPKGDVDIKVTRFASQMQKELLCVKYQICPHFSAKIEMIPYLDANVHNIDSNYDETFWDLLAEEETEDGIALLTQTKENPFGVSQFTVAAAMDCESNILERESFTLEEGLVSYTYLGNADAHETVTLEKYVLVFTDRDYEAKTLTTIALRAVARARDIGYSALEKEHANTWRERWKTCDVQITGDAKAQQGIRFNLFQLLSTYSGDDARLNIGPKGFTGEKYGGATYWDTEAYCLPVYMGIAGKEVAKQLLLYRYLQLDGAYHNAKQQGLKGALFPMVTFTGIECHNEWEITFEEIHRNAAIAYAIYHYANYTGDTNYYQQEGLDVLCGIARFFADRVHFSTRKQQYMIHGVTGPNEYENNVNNNWYTNTMAVFCLDLFVKQATLATNERKEKLSITTEELAQMQHIIDNMYYPYDKELDVFVQHDTFLDKHLMPASELPANERPINQNWSWDKILRSCFIKQADVLQGLYFLNHKFDLETIKRNFDFYEPMTVHESSLSPCVHSILAAQLGYQEKAIEMYERTARLDLDNINNDTEDGLHTTSMTGSWLSIVHGFAGLRTVDGFSIRPFLPKTWEGYSFQLHYQDRIIKVEVNKQNVKVTLLLGSSLDISIFDKNYNLVDSIQCDII